MPNVSPFLSATKEDLDADCRPGALNAVNLAGGMPITMETWDTEYKKAVEVCREKITESSHYIGIFAFRRGWTPPELQKSITEAEFDWAENFEKPMVVFLPNPTARFTLKLRKRASKQSESDYQAQEEFLKKVRQKTCQLFDNPSDLSCRVAIRVLRWANSLRTGPGAEHSESQSEWRPPDEVEINKLGRTDQERNFEDTLNMLRPGWPRTVCFLIHGPTGQGHSRLAARFRKKLETKRGTKQYTAAISARWRKATSEKLIEVIGSSIVPNLAVASIEVLAERLNKMLKDGDVILEISDVQRLGESLSDFAKTFWQPLVAALGESSSYRLIVLATLEGNISNTWEQYLQPPLKKKCVTFDPNRLIKLPKLQSFKEEELSTWLENGGWVEPKAIEVFAQVLITETQGRPETLFQRLAHELTWKD